MKPEEAINVINGIENLELRIEEDKAINMALEALEKQVPKSYDIHCNASGVCYDCPECGVKIDRYDNYCFNCGQRQDWGESE